MVILYEPFGGLSNNLFQHIHFNSFCQENGIPFVNYFLESGEESGARHAMGTKLKFRYRKLLTALGFVKLLDFKSDADDHSAYEHIMRSGKTVFVKGWGYRNKPLTQAHRDFYRNSFYKSIGLDDRDYLSGSKPNIAVHIRRGDYKTWENGKYYFDDSVYIAIIKQALAFVGKDCRILVFSNDPQLDRELYKRTFNDLFVSRLDERSDHYLMSRCQYIIGPPSSFSMWASYIGNTKFCHIRNAGDLITESSFSVCEG